MSTCRLGLSFRVKMNIFRGGGRAVSAQHLFDMTELRPSGPRNGRSMGYTGSRATQPSRACTVVITSSSSYVRNHRRVQCTVAAYGRSRKLLTVTATHTTTRRIYTVYVSDAIKTKRCRKPAVLVTGTPGQAGTLLWWQQCRQILKQAKDACSQQQ